MRPGLTEIMVLLVLVLVVFGPQRLPEIARQIGRAIREVRKISGEFEREVRSGLNLDEDYGGNFPTWKGPSRPPMDKADPYRPPPAPGSQDVPTPEAPVSPSEPSSPDETPDNPPA